MMMVKRYNAGRNLACWWNAWWLVEREDGGGTLSWWNIGMAVGHCRWHRGGEILSWWMVVQRYPAVDQGLCR